MRHTCRFTPFLLGSIEFVKLRHHGCHLFFLFSLRCLSFTSPVLLDCSNPFFSLIRFDGPWPLSIAEDSPVVFLLAHFWIRPFFLSPQNPELAIVSPQSPFVISSLLAFKYKSSSEYVGFYFFFKAYLPVTPLSDAPTRRSFHCALRLFPRLFHN